MKRESNLILYGALLANFGIAAAKFVAAAMTGSSAMLTEGFHSVVDGFNEIHIGDKTYRYARKNLWRCAWGEHFDLDHGAKDDGQHA